MKELSETLKPCRGRRPPKYDWPTMFNGKAWLLVRGEDYQMRDDHMRSYIVKNATKHGVRAIINLCDEGIKVQAIQREKGGEEA